MFDAFSPIEKSVRSGIFSSPAGKARLAERLVSMLPPHSTYVEPFAGGAAVFFNKEPATRSVLNDADPDIARAYKLLKGLSAADVEWLGKRNWKSERELFLRLKKAKPRDQMQWLYQFLYLKKFSIGSMMGTFNNAQSGTTYQIMARLKKFLPLLKNTRIHHGDFETVCRKYDSPDTLFFLDPPYAGYNARVGEKAFSEERFMSMVASLKGKVLITYGVKGDLHRQFAKHGLRVRRIAARRDISVLPGTKGDALVTVIASNFTIKSDAEIDDGYGDAAAVAALSKLAVADINPEALREVTRQELTSMNRRLHQLYGAVFAGNDRRTADGLSRETLINAAVFMWAEMKTRGMNVAADTALAEEVRRFVDRARKADAPLLSPIVSREDELPDDLAKRTTAEIRPSGDGQREPVAFGDIVAHAAKPIVLRAPFISLVGSVANRKETRNDIDVLVHGPLDEATRHVVEFRLRRMLPPKLSQRVTVHDSQEYGGPFTDHAHLYDLVLAPRDDRKQIVEMSDVVELLTKQGDPAMDWPKATGPRPAVIHAHAIGRGVHLDWRFKVDGHLIGWTMFAGRKGEIEDINGVAALRDVFRGYTVEDGNAQIKPLRAPHRMGATKKLRQPTEWLAVTNRVFPAGETGAASEEQGVIVSLARPGVEWGLQKPHFHEYFVTGVREFAGPLYLRMLVGAGGEEQEVEEGRRTPAGRPYWTAMLSKDALPSVLGRRAVKTGAMPPVGRSALPRTLEEVVPESLRYWKAKTPAEAKATRDALVKERVLTEANTAIVGGQFRRTTTKRHAFITTSQAKAIETGDTPRFALSWLFWRGPMHVRVGPSREVWLLMVEDEGHLVAWELQNDPRVGDAPISAVARRFRGLGLLAADQELKPGEGIDGNVLNTDKETPAWLRRQAHGKVRVVESNPERVVLAFTGEGMPGKLTLTREEQGSDIWVAERTGGRAPARKTAGPIDVRKALTPSQQRDLEAENAAIAASKKRPAASARHPFVAAKFTHPNGHPRCRVCGSESNWIHVCNPTPGELAVMERGLFAHVDGDRPVPCQHRGTNNRPCGKSTDVVLHEGTEIGAYRRPLCVAHRASAVARVADKITRKLAADSPPKRTDLKPGEKYRPMKPSGGIDVGEFREIEPLLAKWATPEVLRAGIFVEPKWNGMRTSVQRTGDGKASLWFEDSKDERRDILPGVAKQLAGMNDRGAFILDAELMDYDGATPQQRATLGRFTGPVKPQDDRGVRLYVFRVLYWDKAGGNLTEQDETEQAKTLSKFFGGRSSVGHLYRAPQKLVRDKAQLKSAIESARKAAGSDGAMLKRADATYSLGGQTSSWAKVKTVRRVDALVIERTPVKGSTKTAVLTCAVGPVANADDFDQKAIVEHGGKKWLRIGKTGNTNVEASVGDIVQVAFFELNVDRRPGQRSITWFGPPVVELLRDDRRTPTSIRDVEQIATESEVRKLLAKLDRLPVFKAAEERFVLGIVLEPNDGEGGAPLDPDSQQDIYSAEEIRQAAHLWMIKFRNVGFMHSRLIKQGVHVLESYIAPVDFDVPGADGTVRHIRKGTWLLALRIADNKLWRKVKAGKLTGLSIGGEAHRRAAA